MGEIKVIAGPYWEDIVDYYYDHVHYDSDTTTTLSQWMEKKYNCTMSSDRNFICFKEDRDKTLFLLRWA